MSVVTNRDRNLALARTALTLVFWFLISSSVILTTKGVFEKDFQFPLTVTAFSNTLTTIWAALFSARPRWRPKPLARREFINFVLPIGVATALEISCANKALNLLTVSFGTILKGGSPVFTMMWGLLLGVETFSVHVCTSLFVIALGIALAAFGQHKFVLTGLILQLLAIFFGGFRWAMTQSLLKGPRDGESRGTRDGESRGTRDGASRIPRDGASRIPRDGESRGTRDGASRGTRDGASRGTRDGESCHRMPPLTATLYTSPTMALCVLPVAIWFEGHQVAAKMTALEANELWIILGTMVFIGTLVFILLMSEYWLVNATSSVGVSVAAVFKELLTIAGGITFFKDKLTPLNAIGFTICQMGIGAYAWLRYEPDKKTEVSQGPASEVLLTDKVASDGEGCEIGETELQVMDSVPQPDLETAGQ